MPAPVVEVDCSRIFDVRNHLKYQNGVRHLDPAASHGLPDLQKFANQRSHKGFRIPEAKFFDTKQAVKRKGSSAWVHCCSPLLNFGVATASQSIRQWAKEVGTNAIQTVFSISPPCRVRSIKWATNIFVCSFVLCGDRT